MDKKTTLMLARMVRASYWGIEHKVTISVGGNGNYVVKMTAIKTGFDAIVFSTIDQWESFQAKGVTQ